MFCLFDIDMIGFSCFEAINLIARSWFLFFSPLSAFTVAVLFVRFSSSYGSESIDKTGHEMFSILESGEEQGFRKKMTVKALHFVFFPKSASVPRKWEIKVWNQLEAKLKKNMTLLFQQFVFTFFFNIVNRSIPVVYV